MDVGICQGYAGVEIYPKYVSIFAIYIAWRIHLQWACRGPGL